MTRTIVLKLLAPAALALGAASWATANPAPAAAPAPATPATVSDASAVDFRYVVAPTGNKARYRVRERLTIMELPYDAVGETSAISGAIVITDAGVLVPAQSRITINVTGLKSDQERRDGYVQRRLLETEQHPNVVFAPTSIRGLSGPLPTSGSRTFQLVGNMTVKGVTKTQTWDVTAQFQGGRVTGQAVTSFTFADYGMEKPSVGVILSLADELKLEYDFTLVRQAAS